MRVGAQLRNQLLSGNDAARIQWRLARTFMHPDSFGMLVDEPRHR